jgi:hypothetical protein
MRIKRAHQHLMPIMENKVLSMKEEQDKIILKVQWMEISKLKFKILKMMDMDSS